MALTKVTTKGITDSAVTTDKIAPANVTTAKIGPSAVESSEINDGTVTASDLASSLDLSGKTVTLPGSATANIDQNIALLGFKMAVNDGLTVFNLVDGVVDEFHDESGTDEAEGSNDLYNCSSDYYINSTTPDGSPSTPVSAGFSLTAVTEPQTSTAGNNPAYGEGAMASFTVPACVSAVDIAVWGAGGGFASRTSDSKGGAGGGYAEGTLAVTGGQVLHGLVGYGGGDPETVSASPGSGVYANAPTSGNQFHLPGAGGHGGAGGGLSGVWTSNVDYLNKCSSFTQDSEATVRNGSNETRTDFSPIVPATAVIAGAGGGSSRPSPTGRSRGLPACSAPRSTYNPWSMETWEKTAERVLPSRVTLLLG